jgi:hypothetical protein
MRASGAKRRRGIISIVVDAFLAASRDGDFDALLAVLDPDVVVRADLAALPVGASREVRGAPAVAKRTLAFSGRAQFAQAALVNGAVGIVVAPAWTAVHRTRLHYHGREDRRPRFHPRVGQPRSYRTCGSSRMANGMPY